MHFLLQILKDHQILDAKLGIMEFAPNALSIGLLMLIIYVLKLMDYVELIQVQIVLVVIVDMI